MEQGDADHEQRRIAVAPDRPCQPVQQRHERDEAQEVVEQDPDL
jgi:hypothetical protein